MQRISLPQQVEVAALCYPLQGRRRSLGLNPAFEISGAKRCALMQKGMQRRRPPGYNHLHACMHASMYLIGTLDFGKARIRTYTRDQANRRQTELC